MHFSAVLRGLTNIHTTRPIPGRHDPTALPTTPILHSSPGPHPFSVHWWDADTVGIVGVNSPTPQELPTASGPSYAFDFEGTLSWSKIADSESDSDCLISQHSSTSTVSVDSWASTSSSSTSDLLDKYEFPFTVDGEMGVFGDAGQLKRVSTITKAVGAAKRNRRRSECKATYDAEPLARWRRAHGDRGDHILNCIIEEDEEED